jgi:hypothetical protein
MYNLLPDDCAHAKKLLWMAPCKFVDIVDFNTLQLEDMIVLVIESSPSRRIV